MREHKNKISQLLSLGVRSDETFTPKLQTPVEKSVFLQRQKPSKTVGYHHPSQFKWEKLEIKLKAKLEQYWNLNMINGYEILTWFSHTPSVFSNLALANLHPTRPYSDMTESNKR